MEMAWWDIRSGMGENGRKVKGIRNINGGYKIEEVKNSIGNREAREFIHMTHGHELRW